MVNFVKKRTGKTQAFEPSHIRQAISNAMKSVGEEENEEIIEKIIEKISSSDKQKISVEEIQDIIENELMEHKLFKVAKAFIIYREEHKNLRKFVSNKEKFINKYKKASNTANATIDDNSNVASKNIGVLNAEIHKEDNVHISRSMVMNKLQELYPDFNEKMYKKDLENKIIYKHDESSFAGAISPYCASISMYPFLCEGLKPIGGLSAKPKNLDSFCGLFINLIFATSAQFAGAVATSEFFVCFDYFARKKWGDHYYKYANGENAKERWHYGEDGEKVSEGTIGQQIHQYFQQVVYSINQPAAARGLQSAFVNFSYFDKAFFDGMFDGFRFPDGTETKWESVSWLQKEFMMWFNEERLKCMITFPVESFALVFKDGKFADEESFNFVCEEYARGHSFFTYISDTVDSLSSCCFTGEETIKIKDPNGIWKTMSIKDFVNSQNDKIDQIGSEDLNYDASIISYNLNGEEEETSITGILKKLYTGKMYKFYIGDKTIEVTEDHPLMAKDKSSSEIKEILTKDFDKDSHLIAVKNKKLIKFQEVDKVVISNVENHLVYDIQLEKNHFFSANGVITHNCRLKNKIQTKEFNFTNGNMSIQTGSKSVITTNLNRIIQNFCRKYNVEKGDYSLFTKKSETFKRYFSDILERIYKYHTAYDSLLREMYDSDLLPIYKAGFINLDKQYLTIGINGLNQAAEFLGLRCSDNEDYQNFCQFLFSFIKEQNIAHKTKNLSFNTECVPAESLAIKNYNWDKSDGYWVPEDLNLYASYIYKPNDNSVDVLEKIRMHGSRFIGDYLDGGSAAHINLEEHLSAEQYRKLLIYSAKQGCQYITWNIPNWECPKCGKIGKSPVKECPNCGCAKLDYYDRVIGFLTKIANWSDGRKAEQALRVYSKRSEIQI